MSPENRSAVRWGRLFFTTTLILASGLAVLLLRGRPEVAERPLVLRHLSGEWAIVIGGALAFAAGLVGGRLLFRSRLPRPLRIALILLACGPPLAVSRIPALGPLPALRLGLRTGTGELRWLPGTYSLR